MDILHGVDVSDHQGELPWDQLHKEIDFVMIRASYGLTFDRWYSNNRQYSRSTNTPHGYYHYGMPSVSSPEDQANFFIDGMGIQKNEILALDFEDESFAGDIDDWCYRFLKRCSDKLDGYKPLLYVNPNFINKAGGFPKVRAGDYGLWCALWDDNAEAIPGTPWAVVAMKQYLGDADGMRKATVAGITPIDLDAFYGNLDTFYLYAYKPKEETPVEPQPKNYQVRYLGSSGGEIIYDGIDKVKAENLYNAESRVGTIQFFIDSIQTRSKVNEAPKPIYLVTFDSGMSSTQLYKDTDAIKAQEVYNNATDVGVVNLKQDEKVLMTKENMPNNSNEFYTIQETGLITSGSTYNVVSELIRKKVWSGTVSGNIQKFNDLGNHIPVGGWKVGMKVRVKQASGGQPIEKPSLPIINLSDNNMNQLISSIISLIGDYKSRKFILFLLYLIGVAYAQFAGIYIDWYIYVIALIAVIGYSVINIFDK